MQKQRKIILDDILEEYIIKNNRHGTINWDSAIEAMKEACRQTLEFAAENNANVKERHVMTSTDVGKWILSKMKQSILGTIKQIE